MRKIRGRFEIVCPFDDGETYATFTSDKTRSLSAWEIITCLRRYADQLESFNAPSVTTVSRDTEGKP